jgi:NAD(P)-dependent dehydrogenase (short-subunit alcohol dehydrogenase family)
MWQMIDILYRRCADGREAVVASIGERLNMDGRVAVITGAGRGIGRAIANGLAEVGAAVVIAERDEETGPEAERALRAEGHTALWLPVDVRDQEAVESMMKTAVQRFGHVDVLVNNAGGTFVAPAIEIRERGFMTVLNLNLTSAWLCSQAAARAMVAAGHGGSIVSIASMNAFVGSQNMVPYGAAKAAIVGMTHALAAEWAEYGIRVNAVAPGPIATEGALLMAERRRSAGAQDPPGGRRIPLGRQGLPEEVGSAVVFLASDLASYVTGQTLLVDGGATIA